MMLPQMDILTQVSFKSLQVDFHSESDVDLAVSCIFRSILCKLVSGNVRYS